MLLSGYTKNIFRPECNSSFESVHCVALLNEDVGDGRNEFNNSSSNEPMVYLHS